jgi:hypothetical protein
MSLTIPPYAIASAELMQQQLLSSMQASSAAQASAVLDAMSSAKQLLQDLQTAIDRLRSRIDQTGAAVDAAGIRAALAKGQALDALFAADPASLGASLAEAGSLDYALRLAGLDANAALSYPVLVISIENGKTVERLAWMNEAQRARLDALPLSAQAGITGGTGHSETGKDGSVTSYCCLDAYRTLRSADASLSQILGQGEASLHASTAQAQTMAAAFAAALFDNEAAVADMMQLLEAARAHANQHLEKLHEERLAMFRQDEKRQKDMERRQQDARRDAAADVSAERRAR